MTNNNYNILTTIKLILILLLPFSWLQAAHASFPEFWKESAYAIECTDHNLREVMDDFSSSFGVALEMDGDVGGSCQGWLRADNAVSFLDSLSYKYQFQWYVFHQTLYISSFKSLETSRIEIDSNLKVALRDLGLYQEKFGWGELGDSDVALISAPKSYIKHIKNLLKGKKKKIKAKKKNKKIPLHGVYVIPVKYASVSDRTLKVRGQSVTIPGVAKILSKVLEGQVAEEGDNGLGAAALREQSSGLLKNIKVNDKKKVSVQADIRTNSLIIKSPDERFNQLYFENLVKKLDKPQDMIEIDAIIVDIDKEKLRELGVNNVERLGSTQLGFRFDSSDDSNSTIFVNNPGKFAAELKALESVGEASIVANTSILTMENQSAIIDLSETFFIQSIGERVASTEPFTTGTLLNVTPQLIKDKGQSDKIKLLVEIEDGRFVQDSTNTLPIISKSNINTAAVVERNQALVIGGYHVEEHKRNVNKIPVLGDIPVMGNLFSLKTSTHNKRERIFIIAPRVSPAHHRIDSYSYFGDDDKLAKSFQRIQQRWKRSSQKYAEVFVDTVNYYLKNYANYESKTMEIPGFQSSSIGKETPFSCHQDDISFKFSKNKKFSGDGIEIYTGRAYNNSELPKQLYEKSCFGSGLIGVSYIDSRELKEQWKSSRVLVAIERAKHNIK